MRGIELGPWLGLALLCAAAPLRAEPASDPQNEALARLARAATAYRAGAFADCARHAAGLEDGGLRNPDAVLLLRAQCAFYAGRPRAAATDFARLIAEHPASPHTALARWRQADCLWALGERRQAAARYSRADAAGAAQRADAAVGLARRAALELDRGRPGAARQLWLDLRRLHPTHPLAGPAPPGLEPTALSAAQSLELGRALHRARAWQRALAVLDGSPDPGARPARFALAMTTARVLFDMRFHYEQAARMLLAARERAPDARRAEEAWLYASRALGRCDRDRAAIDSHLAMVERHPDGRHTARALFYAGWLEQNLGRCERALALFERVRAEHGESRWARSASWFSAWCLLRLQRWQAAIAALQPQLEWRGWRFGGRARYWTGVAQTRLGREHAARTTFGELIAAHPLTWYAALARERLGTAAPALPQPPPAAEREPLADALLQRADELARAGLGDWGALLLRRREQAFLARHPGRGGRLALMAAYRRSGDFHRPWYLSLVRERRALFRLPSAATRPIWNHAYPACERDRLRAAAGGDEALVLLLQAIMRTESGFAPDALSVADARGLMQMIPPTATRVAAELGLEHFTPNDLFDPGINIRTATWYIGRLVKKFKRQWPIAAAAYNAGPEPMMEWCRERGRLPLDVFVESIPYTESRRYAKRVYTSFWRYCWLAGRPRPALELDWDPDYLPIEPNF